ncbi:MAG: hypothetical protein U9O87_01605, partial [Verrucomicrobiota bacterium]|nr:hypothetical protein [Verrucomicrobiota bacterium]
QRKSSKKRKFILFVLFPITVFIALVFFFYKGEKTSNSSQNTKFQQTIERKQTGVVLPTIQKNKIEEKNTTQKREIPVETKIVDPKQELFNHVIQLVEKNPNKYDDGIDKLKKIKEDLRGTKYSRMVDEKINELQKRKNVAVMFVMKILNNQANIAIDKNDFDGAKKIYSSYFGKLVAETASLRTTKIKQVDALKMEHIQIIEQQKMKNEKQVNAFYRTLTELIFRDRLSNAYRFSQKIKSNPKIKELINLKEIDGIIKELLNSPALLATTFKSDIDKEKFFQLKTGKTKLKITKISSSKFTAVQTIEAETMGYNLKLADFADSELIPRISEIKSKYNNYTRGFLVLKMKKSDLAKHFFSQESSPLSEMLLQRLKK